MSMTLKFLIEESARIAKEHGWDDPPKTVPEDVGLFHSEVSEALEEHRAGRKPTEIYFTKTDKVPSPVAGAEVGAKLTYEVPAGYPGAKPEGIPIEIADILIRVGHFCKQHEIDIEEAVRIKMAFNSNRPYRHGLKKL